MAIIRRRTQTLPSQTALTPTTDAVVSGLPPQPPNLGVVAAQPRAITAIVNQANACLGLVGLTGAGKTSLAVTAVVEAWEVYGKVTHWYASDLGGWGNQLLSLIRLGICHVWYIRNHHNPFTTMELASQGCWPETMQDRETGLAAPDVRLIPPRQTRWTVICPNDHAVASYGDVAQATAMQLACPTCGVITTAGNALRMDRTIVRSAGFRNVGHYVFDSMTQMSEYGLTELRNKSARGELPAGHSGGSALGSADALREVGGSVFGTGSLAQYGFMQDRVPVWIGNMRAIPDQVLPPIVTFGIEYSKGSDESGGMPMYGPKIAGNKRTPQVPGWLGNCLYAAKEPHNPPDTDDQGNVKSYHRLWLVNHPLAGDAENTPIVAKHRGEPLGMPDYLEDSGKPEEAWQRCSLREFYRLLRVQAEVIEARDRAKYANAPALAGDPEDEEEVLEVTRADVGGATQGGAVGGGASSSRVIRRRRSPGAGPALPSQVAPVFENNVIQDNAGNGSISRLTPEALTGSGLVQNAAGEWVQPPTSSSVVEQQLKASLAERQQTLASPEETAAALTAFDTKDASTGGNGHAQEATVDASAPPMARPVSRIRRVPRPPAE
jgi:hypothetical protein